MQSEYKKLPDQRKNAIKENALKYYYKNREKINEINRQKNIIKKKDTELKYIMRLKNRGYSDAMILHKFFTINKRPRAHTLEEITDFLRDLQ